jgi:small-conductance mechanosensitive channel
MEEYKIRIIETAIVLLSYLIMRFVIRKAIEKMAIKFAYQSPRVKIIKKLVNILLFALSLGLLLFIWGVDQSELIFFISSLLTILGIAFFAQWSIISNITSTLIIFFNHPAKIGDTVAVFDKDYPIEGRISDIGVFFVIIKTVDDEKITIPSNVFIQKMIKQKDNI